MKITDFDLYKDLLIEKSGLTLSSDKTYLLDSRLNPVAKKWEFSSLEAMTAALRGMPDQALINDIVEAMTTNETSFFRDTKPFEILKQTVIPYLLKTRAMRRNLNIWCAAASSGQEPYSIALTLKELEKASMAGWRSKILGTDISLEILEQAKAAIYSQFEAQRGLPIQMLMSYFTQQEEKWVLKDDIKNMVEYKQFNLLHSMSALGKFDIVFCRNVLIYFNEETKADVLRRIAAQMEPDGFLFLGGAETVMGMDTPFEPVPQNRGLYALTGSVHLDVYASSPKLSSQALA